MVDDKPFPNNKDDYELKEVIGMFFAKIYKIVIDSNKINNNI